jgi:hypothetical protein
VGVIAQHLLVIGITDVLGAQAINDAARGQARDRTGKLVAGFAQVSISRMMFRLSGLRQSRKKARAMLTDASDMFHSGHDVTAVAWNPVRVVTRATVPRNDPQRQYHRYRAKS